jgi:hypothetical protein
MGAPTPQVLLEAIGNAAANGASPGDKTFPIPDAPTGTNAASIQGGFPAVTMESILAGGLPPFGQDMTGFLFLISSHTLWVESGQLYPFSSDLAAAIDGYLQGTILGMADGTGAWLCTAGPNSNDPDTGGAGWTPINAYGVATVPITGGVVTLDTDQTKYPVIVLTGILASNAQVQLPTGVIQEWLVVNNTTNAGAGTFITTVLTPAAGSTGVTVPQGGFASPTGVYTVGDGNVYPTVSPLAVPISISATPLTLAERDNVGRLIATYFGMTAPADDASMFTVITTSGDGILRQNHLTNFEGQLLLQGFGGQLVNGQVPFSVISQWAASLFASAALTGVPTAPTAAAGTSTTQIATTAFSAPPVTVNSNGTCLPLPNGYKINVNLVNAGPVTFAGGAYAGPPVVVAGSVAGGATQSWVVAGSVTNTGCTIANTGGQTYYIAIGK